MFRRSRGITETLAIALQSGTTKITGLQPPETAGHAERHQRDLISIVQKQSRLKSKRIKGAQYNWID